MKGQAQPTMDVDVEGGTIGSLTLRVSDEQVFSPGERAVFFVRRRPRPSRSALRGQGLLKLDRLNRVPGSSLTLDEIRRTVGPGEGGRTSPCPRNFASSSSAARSRSSP